ncbi:MAG: type I DNA topoisomerase [Myxococcales bacterium]|jgi:DNA topoisomerase-1
MTTADDKPVDESATQKKAGPTKKASKKASKKATKKATKKKAAKKKATKKKATKKKAAGNAKGSAAGGDGAPAKKAPRRISKADSLLIVESPAKAKTIQKYLGKDFVVIASKGHVKDLPKRGGVDVDNGFAETYEVIQEKGKDEVLRTIKENARGVNRVLLATDPDREGEAIAWHLAEEVKKDYPEKEVRRVLFNEITKKGVQEGIDHPRDLDQNLYEAQRTRRVLDRIGGYPLSNLLWRKLAFGLSAGRVQTPALRILVDRQHEIDSFVPRPYWLIEARLGASEPPPFTAMLDSVGGEKLEKVSSRPAATSELDARRFEEDLAKADYRIAKVVKRERRSRAPAPYITSKLQQDASNRLGMNPKRTMRVAQALYEGIALGRGKGDETVGLITYMRTDSLRVSDDAVAECRDFIKKTFGDKTLPDRPNVFKAKKQQNVQDAHEAIRPTRMDLPPDAVKKFLTDERFRLYKLIWDRFVASQMVPAVYDQTSLEIEAKAGERSYGLRASGSILKFAGWKTVYGAGDKSELAGEEGQGVDDDDRSLPPVQEGETLSLNDPGVTVTFKETEPPPYYNEASLVKKLEEEGIGRPSTYAEIISKVQARDYVKKSGNKLVPTDLGKLVIERLVADKFDLADLDFTRKLEEDLDAVAEARGKRLDVLAPFHERLQKKIATSLEEKGKWWPEPESIDEKCPECGKDLYKRWGRNGQFIGCEGYPDCKYTRAIPQEGDEDGGDRQPQLTDYKCEECGAPMMKRWGRNGWFLGCSKFPKCKFTRSVPLGVTCPKCGGEVIEIRARNRRRPFYGCRNYSNPDIKCDFRIWQRPYPEPCPKCKATFLVRGGKPGEPTMRCQEKECDYERPLTEEEQQAMHSARDAGDAPSAAQG